MYNPVQQNQRIELIDAIRGFALLGILMVNMPLMYEPMSKIMLGSKEHVNLLQYLSETFIKFFFEGKFFLIFSTLFGYGFYIFMQKAEDIKFSVLTVFRRRLFVLLLFGLLHIFLLWGGDVLFVYSLFGFLLILFRNSANKTIIRWALFFILFPVVALIVLTSFFIILNSIPEMKTEIDLQNQESLIYYEDMVNRARQTYSSGTFPEIISMRLEEYFDSFLVNILFFCPTIMGMFLIGLLAAKNNFFSDVQHKKEIFKRFIKIALPTGIICNLFYVISLSYADFLSVDFWLLLNSVMGLAGGLTFSLCYISLISLSFIYNKNNFLIRNLVPVGRMALTNYLSQSLICAILFHSYGFAFYSKIEIWQGILLTFLIFSIQIIFSRIWLRYFLFGPLEWIWRSLTYLKFQPFLKAKK